jgi:excisionase family DNA binding protein
MWTEHCRAIYANGDTSTVNATDRPVALEALQALPEARRLLNLSDAGVRRLVLNGQLPAVRIGRRLLFEPDALRRFIEEHRTRGGP